MQKQVKEDMTGWNMWEHGVDKSKIIVIQRLEDHVQPSGKRVDMWLCKCNCGSNRIWPVRGDHIKTGAILSCGCVQKQRVVEMHKKNNVYKLNNHFGIGIASNCNEEFYFDLDDYEKIKSFCWYKDSTGYMKTRTPENKWIHMHRLVTNNAYNITDHINRNKLDNRKENLRDVTKQINMLNRNGPISTNTSGVTGVWFNTDIQKWAAQICVDDINTYIGSFDNKEGAIKARLRAEKEHYGEFAPQRHLFEKYNI